MSYAEMVLATVPAAPPTTKNQRATSWPAPISAIVPYLLLSRLSASAFSCVAVGCGGMTGRLSSSTPMIAMLQSSVDAATPSPYDSAISVRGWTNAAPVAVLPDLRVRGSGGKQRRRQARRPEAAEHARRG